MRTMASVAALAGAAFSVGLSGEAFAQTAAPAPAQPRPATTAQPIAPVAPVGQNPSIAQTAQRYAANTNGEPDVFLDVPNLSVEAIELTVDKLEVHLALDARLGNLLKLTAGADASIGQVKLTIKGVKAQAQLRVHLDNVAAIIDRTLTTVDRNPQLIERALGTVDNAVGTVGGVANNAVGTVGNVANTALQPGGAVSSTVNSLGQTVTRTVDSAGNTIERVTDRSGKVVSERTLPSSGQPR